MPPAPASCIRLHASSPHILTHPSFPMQAVHRVSLKKLPFTVLSQPGEQQQEEGAEDEEQEEGGSSGEDEDEDEEQPSGDGGSSGSEGGEEEEWEEEAPPLDAFPSSTAAAVEAFAAAVEADPAAFLQPTAELAGLAKAAAKAMYDYQATCQGGAASSGGGSAAALPELYIDGFDAEQIWLQLELAAGPALKRARKLLKKAGEEPLLLTPETEEAIDGGLTGAGWLAGSRFGGCLFMCVVGAGAGLRATAATLAGCAQHMQSFPAHLPPVRLPPCSLQSCWRVLRGAPATTTMICLGQGARETRRRKMRRMLTWQT